MGVFVLRERRARAPLFDLPLLRHQHFRVGLGVVLSYGIGLYATTFLLTFYLQGAVHLGPLDAGLVLVPLSGPQLVMAPLGGWLADRIGPARLVLAGLALLTLCALLLAGGLGPRLNLLRLILPLLVMSAANGLAWPSLTKAVMSTAPPERSGVASGMCFTLRNLGMALSLTLALVAAEVRPLRPGGDPGLPGQPGRAGAAGRRRPGPLDPSRLPPLRRLLCGRLRDRPRPAAAGFPGAARGRRERPEGRSGVTAGRSPHPGDSRSPRLRRPRTRARRRVSSCGAPGRRPPGGSGTPGAAPQQLDTNPT